MKVIIRTYGSLGVNLMNYVVLIADVIDSKKVKDRKQLQLILRDILSSMNKVHADSIHADLTLTLGDEFQGVFLSVSSCLLVMDQISASLAVRTVNDLGALVSLRFGVGLGTIEADIPDLSLSIGGDGRAFWFAREALDYISSNNDYGMSNECFRGLGDFDLVVNDFMGVLSVIRNSWTLSQITMVDYQFHFFGYSGVVNESLRALILDHYGVSMSAQTLSRRIIVSNVKQYVNGRKSLALLIEKRGGVL